MPFRATHLLAELPRLRRYARVLTGDPELADNLVEATLLRFRNTSGGAASHSIHLELLSLLRAVSAEKALRGQHAPPRSLGPSMPAKWVQIQGAGAPSLPDRAALMLAQLAELPLEQREVLVLVAVEQLPYGDIATLLRIPVATVVSRLTQARAALHAVSTQCRSTPNNAG